MGIGPRIRGFAGAAALVVLFSILYTLPAWARFFPYDVHKKTLPNGLDVLVIETPEFKNVLSYNTLVLAGARNEIEAGKSGLAHLFEHILFRHRWKGELNGYDEAISRLGAFNNAWTFFDVTYYHPLTFTNNLKPGGDRPGLAQLEADRFRNLSITEEIFKTEAGAVLGEYRRLASDPGLRMDELLLAALFPKHPYGHSTIGFLEDVEDMPNEFQAAVDFYSTYYRPDNVILLVSGDVEAAEIFGLAEELYGSWEAGEQPAIPEPGPVGGPKREHLDWETDVPPRISFAYRMPAFDPASRESAAASLLSYLLAGETAPLFQKLRFQKKTVSDIFLYPVHYESFDPRFLEFGAILFKEQFQLGGQSYLESVIADIEAGFEELKNFSSRSEAAEALAQFKSRFRYDLLSRLNSPSNLAETFVIYYRFNRDPRVLDSLVEAVESLQPADIDAFARRHFRPEGRVVVTMSHSAEASK